MSASNLARRLVQRAARSAPPLLAERLEEEWLADLATRHGRVAQWRFGIGCCWATRVIAHDFAAAEVPAATTVTASKTLIAHAQHYSPMFSRRTTLFLLVVGFHVFVVYAIKSGLAHRMIEDMPGSIEFFPVPEVKTPIEPPPNKQLDFKRPVIDMPWREVPIDDPPPDPGSIQGAVAPRNEPVTPPPLPPRAITRIMGGPGKGFPNTDDYYPSAARRMSEQGVTAVRVCVDEKGSLMEQPAIAQTSGSARLDEGALKLARAGSGRYRASTEDGRPVSSCYAFRIKFELTD